MTTTSDPLNVWEHAARAFELRAPDPVRDKADEDSWRTPGTLAKRLNPATVQTPALDCVDAALERVRNTPDGRLIITMPPQEGKSTRVAKDFVLHDLKQRPWTRIVGASYGQGLANRNGRSIRNTIKSNPELGMTLAVDNGSASEWQLDGRDGGLVSVGIGAGLTGRPADLMVIDDPIKDRKEADSEVYRQAVWDWWTDVASTRLAPGAPVVVILTRWHEDDFAGRLLAAEDGHLWEVLNIPAQADHDPEKGETDPLGRAPGEFLESARGRTPAQWEAIRTRVGTRTWNALYQGRPSSAEGSMFKRDWWQRYDQLPWVQREDGARVIVGHFDELLISWDMTFKKTEGTDYVAGHVWMRRGADAFLLDRMHGRMDFVDTLAAFKALAARWPQAVLKLVEDKANGPAVISMLARTVPGIVPVEPDGGKEARAAAVSPLVEARNVWLPDSELAPWADDVIEEAAGFPTAAHDDDVDAMSQALNRLILQPLLEGGIVTAEDLDEELADFGSYVP
ncbi:phage terminase large subunit [Nocardioides lacusdianchii]|uniref:phage terminase large subunit n=1 Tax=Nocardioides lacusdianchii TaxID=2783664 RepID=UPI001CCF42B0|nr:phage terminase large subunit [Nocardioides lacusdianchii]